MTPPIQQLQRQAEPLGVHLGETTAAAIVRFLQLLGHFNERIRLTGTSDLQVLVQRHMPDAFAAAALLQGDGLINGSCVDVGSGGGLPALPLALLLERLQMTLVESNQRKCVFLRTAVHDLGLSQRVSIVAQRLEHANLPAGFDLACSRATWAPGQWIAHAAALLRSQGTVLVFVTGEGALPPAGELPEALSLRRTVSYTLDDGAPRLVAAYTVT